MPHTPPQDGSVGNTWALLPVKAPSRGKTRLGGVLDPDECARLCSSMLDDMLAALAAARRIEGVAVLTEDATVASRVEQLGYRVLKDSGDDLNASLDAAAGVLSKNGVGTLLVIPGDLPTLSADDIDELIGRHQGAVSVSPAIRDGGTNAIVCTPPDAIAFHFGKDSAARHLRAAADRGLRADRVPLNAFFRDIDMPEDLAWLSQQHGPGHTLEFLKRSGISARLGQTSFGVAS